MSKEIEVYNTYFGECIVLKEKKDNSNLLKLPTPIRCVVH